LNTPEEIHRAILWAVETRVLSQASAGPASQAGRS
jgi:hypothetical protein